MRALYTAALFLAQPLVAFHLAWRGLRNRGYWRHWPQRFGLPPAAIKGPYDLWIHAVSVGETQVALPLVRTLQRRRPGLRVLVTTTTPTGMARLREAGAGAFELCYLPQDLPPMVGRFLDRVRPRLAVFVETELWPNYLAALAQRRTRVVLANARLSERSRRGYARFGALTREMLGNLSVAAAQSAADGARLAALGLPLERLVVTGSVKFDQEIPASIREKAQVLRRRMGVEREVWIAASTHEGEEEAVLEAHERLRRCFPDALLLLVPRHPERFERVHGLAVRRGFATARRTDSGADWRAAEVVIGDTMGELLLFYAAADVAFVGGSLVARGGHNVLEPAALGLPVVTGPHVFNFQEITDLLVDRGAAVRLAGGERLAGVVEEWLGDANLRHRVGACGRRVVVENRGALGRLADTLEHLLDAPH
ncbi:MAG: lipid IV(A) 3-deoxy-D-manno-octulosonic acid transferase [Gammaproteobacteria bacterium]|nr:lipid IV(A) 3-deoxy-D-manno-octulosonic acid transferase [Gammaproteobacteria bacterium]